MLDEVAPALKPSRKSKVFSPEPGIFQRLSLVESKVSFSPFVNYLKEKRQSVSETREKVYSYLIKRFESEPSLLYPENLDVVQEHSDLMELLTTSLFPMVASDHRHIFALAAPYQFSVFYYSDYFSALFFDDEEKHLLLPDGVPIDELKSIQCASIYDHVLQKFYGVKLNENRELIYPFTDHNTGMIRYYKIRYDSRFIDLKLKGILPPLKDCAVCMNTSLHR